MTTYNPNLHVNVKDVAYGATGNGTTDDSAAVVTAALAAKSSGKGLYFPAGTYLVDPAASNFVYVQMVEWYGESNATSTIKTEYISGGIKSIQICGAEDIRLENFRPDAYPEPLPNFSKKSEIFYRNVYFYMPDMATPFNGNTGVAGDWLYYLTAGTYDIRIEGCVFDLPHAYVWALITAPASLRMERNVFLRRDSFGSLFVWHVVKIDVPLSNTRKIAITDNVIHATHITGIFINSNRVQPIKNIEIDRNELHNVLEEGIACDGLGNNLTGCPVICNGRIAGVSNDANGRVVIDMAQMRYARTITLTGTLTSPRTMEVTAIAEDILKPGTVVAKSGNLAASTTIVSVDTGSGGVGTYTLSEDITAAGSNLSMTATVYYTPHLVSARADWKNFYFIFSENTGADGTIAEIHGYDAAANTITLNLFRNANTFTTGNTTWAGVHAGFFGGSITNNQIYGAGNNDNAGAGATNSTGISLWINTFHFKVDNNIVSGTGKGIIVGGGLMLSTYHALAYHNTITNNTFALCNGKTDIDNAAISIVGTYSGLPQIGNRISGNRLVRGRLSLLNQRDYACEDNMLLEGAVISRREFPPVYPS